MPFQPKPRGEITVTVEYYSDHKVDEEAVREAMTAELDNLELEVDCDGAPDGVAVVGLSAS